MLSVKTKRILTGIVLLSLAAACFFGWRCATVPLGHIRSSLPVGEQIYGLDEGERVFRFFKTDAAGRLLAEIQTPLTEGDSYFRYGKLTADQDQLYVLGTRVSIAGDLIQEEIVYRCNFDKKRLDAVWTLPVLDSRQTSNFSVAVRDGVLTCFQADYTGKMATGRLLSAVQGGSLEEVVAFDYDIGVGFTDFYACASGTVVFTTPAGRVYSLSSKGDGKTQTRRFPLGETDQPLVFFANDGGSRVYAAGTNGRVYEMNFASNSLAAPVFSLKDRLPKESGITPEQLSALQFAPDGSFTATVTDAAGGESLHLFRADGGHIALTALAAPAGRIALQALLGFLAVWALAVILALLTRLFLLLTRGKVPIVTKLLAAFLPILIVSMVLMNLFVTQIFTGNLVDGQYGRLHLLTAQQTATMNVNYLQEMEPRTAYDSVHFYEMRAALNVLPGQGALYAPGAAEDTAQQVYNSNYFWIFKLTGGKLVSLICEQDYVGVPVEFMYSQAISDQFYEAASTGRVLRTGFRDSLGSWTILLTPIVNEAGDVVGVIETGDTRASLDHEVAAGARRLALLNLGVLAVLATLLSCVIFYSLHPLKSLRERVQEISDGKLGVQTAERGNDEVSEIARVFNAMSRNVAFRDKEIHLTSDGYSRFVPFRVFGLLDKSSVIDVRLADQTSVEAMVLNCSVGAFDEMARSLRSKEMFGLINRVLAQLIPVVDRTGGLVDHFDRAGLLAIYTEKPEKALDAAVTLCQTIRGSMPEGNFHVTLSAGPAMIGIVGAAQRLEAMTVSEHTNFTSFLRPLGERFGATILMTDSAAARIPDFATRYHARTIGFVYMRTLDRLERLYDVYDGDEETTRRLKQETRATFEKGVQLFCDHQYYDARLLFIEVLKKHREDKAAKNYLYLCDTNYRRENGETQDVWIESY
ncbi:MAG: HAMP domain-containing protein [Oscillibacter sp.]